MEFEYAKGDGGVDKNYRGNKLYDVRYPNKKKAKKIQKDLFRRNNGIAPPAYEIASIHTGPDPVHKTQKEHRNVKKRGKRVTYDICDCENEIDENYGKGKYIPKTWDSLTKYYGNTDTTEVWNSENQIIKVHQGRNKNKVAENDFKSNDEPNGKNKHQSKFMTRKNHDKYSKKQSISNDVDQKRYLDSEKTDQRPHGTSLISLFRNDNNKNQRVSNLRNNRNGRLSTNNTNEENCKEGPCEEAARNKNKLFHCKCSNKKKEPDIVTNDCTDANCKLSKNAISINNVVKIKDKLLCICHKYSQKIVNLKPNATCKEGICREAEIHHKTNFNCKCEKKRTFNECTDDVCSKYTKTKIKDYIDLGNGDQVSTKRKLSSLQNISTNLQGLLQNIFKQRKGNDDNVIKLEHVSEQTGEPFFEIQVNPRDMCVINPIEIRDNILKYGKPGWNEHTCICPSRGQLKRGEVCTSGVCKKAYKNKQTNFKCWCEKRLTECGDTTCGVQNLVNIRRKRKNRKPIKNIRMDKPLIEVKLDRDKMCVVNPREIEEKMINSMRVNDVCYAGVCRSNAKDGAPHYCRCISRKMISDVTECSEDTCTGAEQKERWRKAKKTSFRNKISNQNRPKRSSFYEIGPNKLNRGNNGPHLNNTGVTLLPSLPKENKVYQETNITNNNNIIRTSRNPPMNYINENNVQYQSHGTAEAITCTCAHACECKLDESDAAQFKNKDKNERKKLAKKLRDKKESQRMSAKDLKRRTKLDQKREKMHAKERLKEIRTMQKKMNEEPLDSNFCTAFLLGLLKALIKSIAFIISLIVSAISDPKGSFWYIRDRLTDPKGTYNKLKKWFNDALIIKKLQISETIRGSDTLTILADHFLDTPLYEAFADKGKTKEEQVTFEQKGKARKVRIRKREQQAIYSCRHNLLTTLRKTPCLWVYHICPNFYPQCLGLLAFMRNFSHILLFLVAFTCWTPCILSFELCRAIMCCFFCTH